MILCFAFLSWNYVYPSLLETMFLCSPVRNKLVNKPEITQRLGFFIFIFCKCTLKRILSAGCKTSLASLRNCRCWDVCLCRTGREGIELEKKLHSSSATITIMFWSVRPRRIWLSLTMSKMTNCSAVNVLFKSERNTCKF